MIAAIILAAGASSRLGQPKQLVSLRGETLLERALRTAAAAKLFPIALVLPAFRSDLLPRQPSAEYLLVENVLSEEGMASSIRAGVTAIGGEDVTAAVILTCDQPAVTPEHLRALTCKPAQVTASRYANRVGVPAYFPASTFPLLIELRGDKGARDLLTDAYALDLPDGDLDIDTPAELDRARARFEGP